MTMTMEKTMTWQDEITRRAHKPVVLLATATNGLKPRYNEILAVSTLVLGPEPVRTTLFRKVPREVLFQAQDYHKISEQQMLADGLDNVEFRHRFLDIVEKGTVFTFNPDFQQSFLVPLVADGTPFLYDLPLLLKGAEAELGMRETQSNTIEDIFKQLYKILGKAPGLKAMCERRGLDPEAPTSVLPADYAVDCLYAFWKLLANYPYVSLPAIPREL